MLVQWAGVARAITFIILASGLTVMVGCAQEVGRQAWVDRSGGTDDDEGVQRRAEGALALLGEAGRGVRVKVLAARGAGAYGWPDGTLFVTRGLVELLDEEELTAALAHELGHLVADGWVRLPATLRGTGARGDLEEWADAIGVKLLQQAGLKPGAMVSMLGKVAGAPGVSGEVRKALKRRIGGLRHKAGPA